MNTQHRQNISELWLEIDDAASSTMCRIDFVDLFKQILHEGLSLHDDHILKYDLI
jgi:hypothetical protein